MKKFFFGVASRILLISLLVLQSLGISFIQIGSSIIQSGGGNQIVSDNVAYASGSIDFNINKELISGSYALGSTLRYEITYSNVYDYPMSDIVISDIYSSGLVYSSIISSSPTAVLQTGYPSGNELLFEPVTLGGTSTGSIVVEFTVDSNFGGSSVANTGSGSACIENCTGIESFQDEQTGGFYVSEPSTPPAGVYNLRVVKTVGQCGVVNCTSSDGDCSGYSEPTCSVSNTANQDELNGNPGGGGTAGGSGATGTSGTTPSVWTGTCPTGGGSTGGGATAGGTGSQCGNGICEQGEDAQNCPADCGQGGTTGGTTGGLTGGTTGGRASRMSDSLFGFLKAGLELIAPTKVYAETGVDGLGSCTNQQSTYNIGDTVYYTILVENESATETIDNVALVDSFDTDQLDFIQVISNDGNIGTNYAEQDGNISWNNGESFSPGEQGVIVLEFEVLLDGFIIDNKSKVGVVPNSEHVGIALEYGDADTVSNYYDGSGNFNNNEVFFGAYPTGEAGETSTSDNHDIVSIHPDCYELKIDKTNVTHVASGCMNTLVYDITVTNDGPAKDDIVVFDGFPGVLDSYTTDSGILSIDGFNDGAFYGISMGADSTGVITTTVINYEVCESTPGVAEEITNTAGVSIWDGVNSSEKWEYLSLNELAATTTDTFTGDNIDTVINETTGCDCGGTTGAEFDLILHCKTADKAEYCPGEKITYELVIENAGTSDKTVNIEDVTSGASIQECDVEWDPTYNTCATELADDYVSNYFSQYTFPTYQDTHETCSDGYSYTHLFSYPNLWSSNTDNETIASSYPECSFLVGGNSVQQLVYDELDDLYTNIFLSAYNTNVAAGENETDAYLHAMIDYYAEVYNRIPNLQTQIDATGLEQDFRDCEDAYQIDIYGSPFTPVTDYNGITTYVDSVLDELGHYPNSAYTALNNPFNAEDMLIGGEFSSYCLTEALPMHNFAEYVISYISPNHLDVNGGYGLALVQTPAYLTAPVLDSFSTSDEFKLFLESIYLGSSCDIISLDACLDDTNLMEHVSGTDGVQNSSGFEIPGGCSMRVGEYLDAIDYSDCIDETLILDNYGGDLPVIHCKDIFGNYVDPIYEVRNKYNVKYSGTDGFDDTDLFNGTSIYSSYLDKFYVPAGETRTFTYSLIALPGQTSPQTLTNTAEINMCQNTSTGNTPVCNVDPEYNHYNNIKTESVTITCTEPEPNLSVTTTVPANYIPGEQVTRQIVACNQDTSPITNGAVNFDYHSTLSFLSSTPAGVPSSTMTNDLVNTSLTRTGISFGAGPNNCQTFDVTFQSSPNSTGVLPGEASIGAEIAGAINYHYDSNTQDNFDNDDTTPTIVTPPTPPAGSKEFNGVLPSYPGSTTTNSDPVEAGDYVMFTLEIANTLGNGAELDIYDSFDSSVMTFVEAVGLSESNYDNTTGIVEWNDYIMTDAETLTIQVIFKVDDNATVGAFGANTALYDLQLKTGCTDVCDTDSVTVTGTLSTPTCTDPVVSVTNAELTCTAGSVTLTASGADNYVWADGTTLNTFTTTMTGTYLVTGYDSTGGCSDSSSGVVSSVESSASITGITGVDPSSCGTSDGTITVTATSTGVGTLEYSLDTITWQSSNVFTGQPSGSYTVYVRMGTGAYCGTVESMTGTLAASGSPTVTVTNGTLACGTSPVTLTASGADSYVWSTGETTATISVSGTGSYLVTGTSSGCDATATAVVDNTANNLTLSLVGTDASCGQTNGTITATASADMGTLEYSIDGGGTSGTWQTSPSFSGLAAGGYTIHVRNGSTAFCEEIFDDISISSVPCQYDLALTKVLSGTNNVFYENDDVTFVITVTNQGEVDASTFTITDYFPAGLTLNDGGWNNVSPASGVGTGTTDYTYNGTLAASGGTVDIPITFTVNGALTGTVINWAEISADDGNDVDSTTDTTNGTTTESPTDNTILNESGDEDDHDPAGITIANEPFFDLALTKVLLTTKPYYQEGDLVTFRINLENQGTINSTGFTITDYYPVGLTLEEDATVWDPNTGVGSGVTTHEFGALAAGATGSVDISFRVNGDAMGSIVNWAEISVDDGDDIDSTPDADQTNDNQPTGPGEPTDNVNNEDGTAGGDEDDHDPAGIQVVEFDLALDKVLTSSSEAEPGSLVTFEITIYNQGNVDADNIIITDYVPLGLTVADANWVTNGTVGTGMVAYDYGTKVGVLPAGGSDSVLINFTADSNAFGQIINWSEISKADPIDGTGVIMPGITDTDSTPDQIQFNGAGETNELLDDNIVSEDGTDIENDGDEDDHDPAFVTVGNVFDLALIKTLSGSTYVEQGDTVTFNIFVENQGGVAATGVFITDYFPAGLTLDTQAGRSNGGTAGTGTSEYEIGYLGTGGSVTIPITFTVNGAFSGELTNWSEISAALPIDENGVVITTGFSSTDIDSTPDSIPGDFNNTSTYVGDDVFGTDDSLSGNGINDEDDHDPASIFMAEFDLALMKVYDSYEDMDANGTLTVGDRVIFDITLYNQGNVDAKDIVVTDYFPTGLTLDDAARDLNTIVGSGSADYIYTSILSAGTSDTISVTFIVNGDSYGEIINWSEITSAQPLDSEGNPVSGLEDIDSTPDQIQFNGGGETNDLIDDNVINEDGKNGEDEDDHDPAHIELGIFDLALTKHLVDEGPYRPGDTVTFDIVLYNQGTIDATNIEVTDYIPAGLTLTGGTTAWINNNDGTATATYDGVIPAMSGGVVSTGALSISFVINETTVGTLVNRSEISDSTDTSGNHIPDIDSTEDDIIANDNQPSGPGEPTDNIVNEDGLNEGDEDDHDPAPVYVEPTYDLALTKINTVPGPNTIVYPGDPVTFTIEVFNQGNMTATDIELTDYIPVGLTLTDTTWSSNADGSIATYQYIDSLDPTMSDTVTIEFVVNQYFSGEAMNWAEISDFLGTTGDIVSDIDSIPDDINFNQDGEDDDQNNDNDILNEDGDEDDHDPAGIYGEVYDLALIKTLAPGSPTAFASGDTIDFLLTISNQGTLTGSVTSLVDHFPAGLTLDDANWTVNGTAGDAMATYAGGVIGPIEPGASTGVVISFYSNGSVTGNVINWAEIAGDDSEIYGTTDTDSIPDSTNFNQDGETDDLIDDNVNNEDGSNGGDEDDHDPEMITLDYFDLALTKVVNTSVNAGPFYPGSLITFDIEVTNQGTVTSNDFTVTDYIPSGLSLADSDWTSISATQAMIRYTDGLDSGDSIIIPITFIVDDYILGNLVNWAEISADDGAYLGGDWDSDPDMINGTTQESPEDNTIDNENGDEDDHDPAQVTIDPYYDLALVKYLVTTTVVEPGDLANFEIKVINQGNIVADDIEITDYIPNGLSLADSDWTDNNDGSATYNNTLGSISPGSYEIIEVTLRVEQHVNDLVGPIVNWAEISADNGDTYGNDVDSMPDGVNHNQDGEDSGLEDDGVTNEDGKNGGDEDDHDPAVLPIGDVFDLALIKTVNTSINAGPYFPGSLVSFDITVTNQGNMPASEIEITDYIPMELTLADTMWTDNEDGTATYNELLSIAPGANQTISVTLQINQHILGQITNRAEISDDNGDDVDSNPNNDSSDDQYDDSDNVTDNSNGDEDDHDPASIEVEPYFDLALIKTINSESMGPYTQGSEVTFDIHVINQGNVLGSAIEITDYIPSELVLTDTDWNYDGGLATYIIDALAAGESIIIPITFTVLVDGGDITNWAEISQDNDFDEDSTPDVSNGKDNESSENDTVNNENGDEDDHDPASITVDKAQKNKGSGPSFAPSVTILEPEVVVPVIEQEVIEELVVQSATDNVIIEQINQIKLQNKEVDHLSSASDFLELPDILPKTGT